MDEEWDDGAVTTVAPVTAGIASEGGRKFTAGRGFKAATDSSDSANLETRPTAAYSDSGWNDSPLDNTSDHLDNNYSSHGRGGRGGHRGGGRGRGGGGFRGNDHDRNGNGWRGSSNDAHEQNGNDDGGFRGRGAGRGRGRGGRGSRGGRSVEHRDGDGSLYKEKGEGDTVKREVYIPLERTTDEDLFTTTITSGINFVKLDEIEVDVSGEDVPELITSFESSGLRQHLLNNIKKSGYMKPTPIQKYAIPIILSGRDLMGCAQTGSGKTAAFLLPIINKLLASQDPPVVENNCCQPKVIIVSPTRELAIQIFEQAKKFAYNSIVKTVVAYGGTSVNHQRNHVQAGCHILVATPGRLNDFIKRKHISLDSVQFLVLDEADRMLDMGFLPCIEQLLADPSMTPTGDRQTLMFSATFPEEIQHLAGKFLINYVFVAVGIVGSASTDVEQIFYQVGKFDKREKLVSMLREGGSKERTVVFVETKRNADFIASFLSENDIKTTSIHGDRLQSQREQALWDFKKGICNILVATGVAARGLDIEGIQHVINYDLPKSIDEYVHRIGRTGRVGNRGKATSFYDPQQDFALAGSLARILKQANQEVPDWLNKGGGYASEGKSDNFGGRDIRGGNFGKAQNFDTRPSEEVYEEW